MTRSVAKSPRVAEQCEVNIHSLTHPYHGVLKTATDMTCLSFSTWSPFETALELPHNFESRSSDEDYTSGVAPLTN
ncbi:hypothetical protein TNCV_1185121 [Trichonephila clavipes]|nr:hypothetical protein TNCV_1185121 [Trichonephila clavipes]